jgi:hypothetical protein
MFNEPCILFLSLNFEINMYFHIQYVFFTGKMKIALEETIKNGNEADYISKALPLTIAWLSKYNPPSYHFSLAGISFNALFISQVKKHILYVGIF